MILSKGRKKQGKKIYKSIRTSAIFFLSFSLSCSFARSYSSLRFKCLRQYIRRRWCVPLDVTATECKMWRNCLPLIHNCLIFFFFFWCIYSFFSCPILFYFSSAFLCIHHEMWDWFGLMFTFRFDCWEIKRPTKKPHQ